jgi:hypothetical protein
VTAKQIQISKQRRIRTLRHSFFVDMTDSPNLRLRHSQRRFFQSHGYVSSSTASLPLFPVHQYGRAATIKPKKGQNRKYQKKSRALAHLSRSRLLRGWFFMKKGQNA